LLKAAVVEPLIQVLQLVEMVVQAVALAQVERFLHRVEQQLLAKVLQVVELEPLWEVLITVKRAVAELALLA
jgi:hypothetical protein